MNETPGSRGWAADARYIATRHGGYPDGPLMTGRSMPSPETATRVARAKLNAPQRIDVPLTILTTKLGLRATGQIRVMSHGSRLSTRATVPVADVRTEVGLAATEPRRAQVPLRIWTL